MPRQGVDLGFVEVGDGFEIGGAIAVFHKKALVVFEPVGGADDRIVQAVGVEIFEGFAQSLLVVGGGDDLQIFAQRQPCLMHLPVRRLGDDLEMVDATGQPAGDGELDFPLRVVARQHRAHGLVAPVIAADGLQRGGDVFHRGFDAELLCDLPAQSRAVVRRIALGHEQAEHPLRPEGAHRQSRAHRAVDAAG